MGSPAGARFEIEAAHLVPSVQSQYTSIESRLKLDDNYSIIISQDYFALDNLKEKGYYLKHNNLNEISLSIRSSIILNYAYNQNLKR